MHPDDLPPTGELVVPDDARDLDREVLAYHRELRAARRTARIRRLVPGYRRSTPRAAAIVAVTIALVLCVLAGLVAVLGPGLGRQPARRTSAPLAHPATAAGKVGGLLPDLALTSPPGQAHPTVVDARSLRPAALVLVPTGCSCGPAVALVLRAAAENRLNAVVIAPGTDDPNIAKLADPEPGSELIAEPLLDPSGTLAKDYRATAAPTLLVVDANGIVWRTVSPLTGSTDADIAVRAALETMEPDR
jgi:hypothetical protein